MKDEPLKTNFKCGQKTSIRRCKGLRYWFKVQYPCKGYVEFDARNFSNYIEKFKSDNFTTDLAQVKKIINKISFEDFKIKIKP